MRQRERMDLATYASHGGATLFNFATKHAWGKTGDTYNYSERPVTKQRILNYYPQYKSLPTKTFAGSRSCCIID